MRNLLGIARYTFVEIFRNRVYYVLLLFAGVLILSTMLLGSLGGEQRTRMIVDMGLGSIELFALAVSVFSAVTLVLEEMESRTLYLVLTRPVARYHFILGRFLGLVALVSAAYVVMALCHIALCLAVHVPIDAGYGLALLLSWEKIVMITSVAMFFSMFATSTPSAVTFTFFFWVMGHFSQELRFLAHRSSQKLVLLVASAFYYIAPNFSLLNLRDMPATVSHPWVLSACAYGLCYTTTSLLFTMLLFRRKEF